MNDSRQRSVLESLLNTVEVGLLSAVVASGLMLALSFPMGALAMSFPDVTDPLDVAWVLVLAPFAGGAGALIGAILAGLRPKRVSPLPWLIVGVAALAVNFLIAALGASFNWPFFSVFVPYFSMFVSAVAVPAASATAVYTLLSRRSPRATAISRLTTAAVIVIAVGIAAIHVRMKHTKGYEEVRGLALSTSGEIYLATDSGMLAADPDNLEWRLLPSIPKTRYMLDVFADLSRPNAILVDASSGLWEYSERRNEWDMIQGLYSVSGRKAITSNEHGVYFVDDYNSLCIRSARALDQWEKRTIAVNGQAVSPVTSIAVNPQNPGELVGGCYYSGDLLYTHDYGNSWEKITLPAVDDDSIVNHIEGVAFMPGSPPVVLVMRSREIFASRDEGESWEPLNPPVEYPSWGIANMAIAPTNPPTLYVCAHNKLFATQDLGDTWRDTGVAASSVSDIYHGIILRIEIDPTDPQTVYVAFSRGLYRSRDGGHTWKPIRWDHREASRQR